ncbi:MAG TPA: kelch repeat-containing protein, partial [Acidimicrobiales bacterium]
MGDGEVVVVGGQADAARVDDRRAVGEREHARQVRVAAQDDIGALVAEQAPHRRRRSARDVTVGAHLLTRPLSGASHLNALQPLSMSPPPAASYRRRRLTALAGMVAVVVVLVVILSSTGHSSHGHHATTASARASTKPKASAGTKAATRPAATPALSLSGIPVGRWTSLPESPTPRGEVSAARIGNVVYVVGGFDSTGHTTSEVQRLDLVSGRWSTVAPMPQPLNHMSAVDYGGRLYVVG